MTQEPQKRRRLKKTAEIVKPEELAQQSPQECEENSPPRSPTPEEKEEQIGYVAWWLARHGFFASEVKGEIGRKYSPDSKAAEILIAAAKERLRDWEAASHDVRKRLASNWWASVITGPDATLPQKMHAMEEWQELNGLLSSPEEDQTGGVSITIIEQVITDRAQIAKSTEANDAQSQ